MGRHTTRARYSQPSVRVMIRVCASSKSALETRSDYDSSAVICVCMFTSPDRGVNDRGVEEVHVAVQVHGDVALSHDVSDQSGRVDDGESVRALPQ